jgi:hypothetical protein
MDLKVKKKYNLSGDEFLYYIEKMGLRFEDGEFTEIEAGKLTISEIMENRAQVS